MEEFNIIPLRDSQHLEKASDCLRTIAHPVRLRMVQLLMRGRYSVGELASSCKVQNHMASEHLRLMQRAGLLKSQRDGRKIYYSVSQKGLFGLMERVESLFGEDSHQ
ncbi:MAG: metalloregulator ArsR/SmtB family transcription factor [Planctomycetota bacterium]